MNDIEDEEEIRFIESVPALRRNSAVSISSCSEATAALRRRGPLLDDEHSESSDGSEPRAGAVRAHPEAEDRRMAMLRQVLEPLDEVLDGRWSRADDQMIDVATLTPQPVATVSSFIGPLVVCDRIQGTDAPLLGVGAALVLHDGTFVGIVQGNIGQVHRCAYVLALDNPQNGHSSASAEALRERLGVGTALHGTSLAMPLVCNTELLRVGATDASTVGDVPLAENQRPDFSDDEEERQWKLARKHRLTNSVTRHGTPCGEAEESDVSSLADLTTELDGLQNLVDEEGNIVAQVAPRSATVTAKPSLCVSYQPHAQRQTSVTTAISSASPRIGFDQKTAPAALHQGPPDRYKDQTACLIAAAQNPAIHSQPTPLPQTIRIGYPSGRYEQQRPAQPRPERLNPRRYLSPEAHAAQQAVVVPEAPPLGLYPHQVRLPGQRPVPLGEDPVEECVTATVGLIQPRLQLSHFPPPNPPPNPPNTRTK